jgi:hypothetical protein
MSIKSIFLFACRALHADSSKVAKCKCVFCAFATWRVGCDEEMDFAMM